MNAVYIKEYGESWCDATIWGKLMWSFFGGKRYPKERKKSLHEDSSHYMVWHKDL